jgi:cell division protein FtsW
LKSKVRRFDFGFLLIVLGLIAFGLVMVFSASSESARENYGDALYFIKRQTVWAAFSIAAMLVTSRFDYKGYKKLAKVAMGLSILLLIVVLLVGTEVKGGKRWLDFKVISFQPSELAKLAVILFFANGLSRGKKQLESFTTGFLPYMAILGLIALLLLLEPHMSATVVIVAIGMAILFAAGAKIRHIMTVVAAGIAGGVALIIYEPYRLNRVTAFLDPFQDKLGDGWQIIQSLYAIGSGGLYGVGLGRSRQKFLYIPEPHNDFIFSILCEELGFIGAASVILLFGLLIYKCVMIAINAPDTFASLVATGITALITVETVINIAVVTSSMPVTGMALPFFSYGGTSLLVHAFAMGIMLNISRHCTKPAGAEIGKKKRKQEI